MRLDKYLADSFALTRKQAQQIIRQGRAAPGGVVIRDPAYSVPPGQTVLLDGQSAQRDEALYLMMYKPAGVLTAARDRKAPTVADLLPPVYIKRGAAPVGRLDKDVTGLLLFTTDGELNHRLTSPKRGVEKTYFAKTDFVLTAQDIQSFLSGLQLGDFTAKPATLVLLTQHEALVTVTEGKFHQVKRMFEAVGKPLTALKRLSMGGVMLDETLLPGQVRPLTQAEIAQLRQSAQMEEA